VKLQALNRQLVTLSRVVLHPTYRGAGVASGFIRASCRSCPWPWIETLAEMGRLNPFFERAGFVRVGASRKRDGSREKHSAIYGGRRDKEGRPQLVSKETHDKSRYAEPVYYVFDNRK
jgi:N-acetylglutamate synthase-like GNAT family acetyltransferase